MDDFARMMEASGVVPIGQPKPQAMVKRPHAVATRPVAREAVRTPAATGPEEAPPVPVPQLARQAWVSGTTARTALEVALQRVKAGDGSGWAIAVLPDGATKPLPTHQGPASLLMAADRLKARLVIVGSGPQDRTVKPFTYVMHPGQGIATLDADPEGEA